MQQKETLSAFIDGQKVEGDFVNVLCNSPELQQKWASYHTIRSVMRGEEQILGADFSAKMAALLEDEQIDSVESSKVEQHEVRNERKGALLKLKRWSTPLLQAGVAASVCLVAVLGVNMMNTSTGETAKVEQTAQPVLQTLPLTNTLQQVSYNIATQAQPTAEQLQYQEQRINELLQDHEIQRRNNANGISLEKMPLPPQPNK